MSAAEVTILANTSGLIFGKLRNQSWEIAALLPAAKGTNKVWALLFKIGNKILELTTLLTVTKVTNILATAGFPRDSR